MGPIDFILNVASLLLWLNWRSLCLDPLARTSPATLAGTLKPAEPSRLKNWQLLAGLVLLLSLRGLVYWELGSPAEWTPRLDLGLIVLAFRNDVLRGAYGYSLLSLWVYSLLSFARVLIVFYSWLLALALINRTTADSDPIQKLLRLHLGKVARWPWFVQLALPPLAIAALWAALHPLLVYLDVMERVHSGAHLVAQGLLLSIQLFLTLKYVLPVFLFIHLIVSYVYLGSNPIWDFISTTARNLLSPLRGLRFARLDFAPVAGVILISLLLHWLPNRILAELAKRNLTLWPQ
jgi:hypothetical protein